MAICRLSLEFGWRTALDDEKYFARKCQFSGRKYFLAQGPTIIREYSQCVSGPSQGRPPRILNVEVDEKKIGAIENISHEKISFHEI